MEIINKTADKIAYNNNTHFELVRRFGGRKVKNVTIKCCASDEWDDEIASTLSFPDAMIVKNPREIHLRDFGGDKSSFLKLPLSMIERYAYEVDGKSVNIHVFDGCLWEINLNVA